MQAILTDVERRDVVVRNLAAACGAPLLKSADKWDGNQIPIIIGNDRGCDEIQKTCRKEGKAYIYIDHAYFTRGYEKGNFRFTVSHYHCTDWRESGKPWPRQRLKEWKRTGEHILIIDPAGKPKEIYKAQKWAQETADRLRQYTNRKIIIKIKGQGDLSELLRNAHAAVCFGSVGDVDAALLGVPIFCEQTSPALPIGETDFSKIETPIYPDREKWLDALAGAEWNIKDMKNCWSRLYGHLKLCGVTDGSRELVAPCRPDSANP